MDASINTHRDRFEQYCRAKFSGSTSDADGDSGEANATPSTSKAIWKEKGTRIVHVLKGDPVAHTYSKFFKFWVKKRGFQIMSYSPLGLKDVLCLPAKKKVV